MSAPTPHHCASATDATGIVTRQHDPRRLTFVAASYYCGSELVADRAHGGAKRIRRLYHVLLQFRSRTDAHDHAERLRADAIVMAGGDIDAMRACAIAAGHVDSARLAPDLDAEELRFLYPPRFDVQLLALGEVASS